jgi:FkbH-like protein
VVLTDAHRSLQQEAARLAEAGILVALVSKNVEEDVTALFERRKDFPLKPSHLAARKISWEAKPAALAALLKDFNILPDAMLFVDDNPGEIAQALGRLPSLSILKADEDAGSTLRALRLFPGLVAQAVSDTDALRSADLQAQKMRKEALGDGEEPYDVRRYLAKMGTELDIFLDPAEQFQRLAELPHKVNQFNLALRRLKETEVSDYLGRREDHHVLAFSVRDRLSNSGNVGAMFVRREGQRLIVDELCLSCRSLGRGIESVIVSEGLQYLDSTLHPIDEVAFCYRHGPRNQPGLRWLGEYAGTPIAAPDGERASNTSEMQQALVAFSQIPQSEFGASQPAVQVRRHLAR